MRYIDLKVINPANGKVAFYASSYPGGVYDPGALNVIFDLYTYQFATPKGGSNVTIEGVDPAILRNAQNFAVPNAEYLIEVSGGMKAGLPLANPAQAGLLFQGLITQSYGNWAGTEINLNLVFYASSVMVSKPNLVLNWTAGLPLSRALTNALTTAYPNAKIKMNIGNYVQAFDEKSFHGNMTQFAQHVSDITDGAVQISSGGDTIWVSDSSYKPPAIQLQFLDFIGQPTWIEKNMIQIITVLRADITPGARIQMPVGIQNQPGFVQTTAASSPSMINYQSAIKGTFKVKAVRQIGNLRQPDGTAWCTVINAAAAV